MVTDPHLTAADPAIPSQYEDPGLGADAALDAFAGDLAEEPPVDPAALLTHDVTAVLVAHDGRRWLPRTLTALSSLVRMPERIIAVDTGSRDTTAELLTGSLGAPAVVSAPSNTGFGAAVQLGVKAADDATHTSTGMGLTQFGHPRTRWIWVLHDDSAPAPDALQRLLEAAVRRPDAGVIGPKVLGWRDESQLLEIGLTITGGGRRVTGLDRREYDQGQHDATREVLAVGSAGMLVRRDVWDELGGFDPVLSIFRDDIDLGWRANQTGHPVIICPEAVVYHAEAAAHGRRKLGATRDRPHMADRRNALYVMLANTTALALPLLLVRVLVGGIGRAVGFLLGKQPALAFEELLAVFSVIGRPDRLIRARTRRRRARTKSRDELKSLFPPRGQQLRQVGENILGLLSGASSGHDVPGAGRRAADDEDEPDDDDTFLLRVILHPAVLLSVGLLIITLISIRGLIGAGRLTGGALFPAPDDVAGLWATYTEAWHGVGLGSPTSAPPYLGVVAVVATVVRNASFAVDLMLLLSVPLAGLSAYLLLRRLINSPWLKVWGSLTYALLPATTGAIAAGRLGTAFAAVVTPLVAMAVIRTLGPPGRPGPFRAAWSAGLLLAVAAAFVPLAWVVALILGVIALLTVYKDRGSAVRIATMLAVTPVVLVPWTGTVLRTPMLLVTEAGLPGPDLSDSSLAPWAVLLQHPGGPGGAPIWLGAGVVLAAWVALLRTDRRALIGAAWVVAGVALVSGVVLSKLPVSGPTLETPVTGWPGYPSVLVGGALIVAAVVGGEGARNRLSKASFGWRQPLAVVAVAAAVLTPLAGAGWWLVRGADDPLDRRDPAILPAYVADAAERPERVRTLILSRTDDGRITYALLRASGPRLGDAETGPPPEKYQPLDDVVADLVSGRGGADGARLAEFAAKYVYLPQPFDPDLADTLDTVPGLVRSSAPEGAAMWQVDGAVARVWVAPPPVDGAEVVPEAGAETQPATVPSGEVEALGSVVEGPDGRTLVVSELSDPGWSATLDGVVLTPTTHAGWAQSFDLGSTAGQVEITHQGDRRAVWLWIQLAAVVVAVVLALPGMRRERGSVDDAADIDLDEHEPDEPVPAGQPVAVAVGGRRRVRAGRAAAPEAADAAEAAPPDAPRIGSRAASPIGSPAAPSAAAAAGPGPAAEAAEAAPALPRRRRRGSGGEATDSSTEGAGTHYRGRRAAGRRAGGKRSRGRGDGDEN